MKIGIDARELELNPYGVGRVLINILKVWEENSSDHRFVLYFKNSIPNISFLSSPLFEKKIIPTCSWVNRGSIWEQVYLPRFINKDLIDVFFSPSYTIPLRANCPAVVIIHDISYKTHPEWFSFRQGLLSRWLTRWSTQRAKKIICCSNFTKQELLSQYGKNLEEKISTVYWAPQEQFKFNNKDDDTNLISSKFQIDQPFFLFVGKLFKRRNIPLLLKSFKNVTEKHPEYLLVLIGSSSADVDDGGQKLLTLIQQLGLGKKVIHYVYLEDKDLAVFYREAFCLTYPSIYEGFGLPTIEAMACGVPVIIPNTQSVKEISAGAAIIVDPLNEENLTKNMIAIIENQDLRRKLTIKGLERVKKLSWKKTASTILSIIESI